MQDRQVRPKEMAFAALGAAVLLAILAFAMLSSAEIAVEALAFTSTIIATFLILALIANYLFIRKAGWFGRIGPVVGAVVVNGAVVLWIAAFSLPFFLYVREGRLPLIGGIALAGLYVAVTIVLGRMVRKFFPSKSLIPYGVVCSLAAGAMWGGVGAIWGGSA